MTAYVSRLLRRADRQTGIRPRPRSRYEPDPGTYLDHGPIEADREWSEQRADPPLPPVIERAIADVPRALPAAPAEGAIPAAKPRQLNREPPETSQPQAQVGAGAPVLAPNVPSLDATPLPDAAPLLADSPTDWKVPDPTDRIDESPNANGASNPSPRIEEQVQAHSRHTMPEHVEAIRRAAPQVSQTSSASPLPDPATDEPRQREAVPAGRPRYSPRATPNPALRQRIVDALVEPVRADPTEVVVHIDRIDVRAAPSSQPPPAAPPRARAAPMSLESYLRTQSRRRPG